MNKTYVVLAISSLVVAGITYCFKETNEKEAMRRDLKRELEKNHDLMNLAKWQHLESLANNYDQMAADIIFIDYKTNSDYLTELMGEIEPRKDMDHMKSYTGLDLSDLSFTIRTSDDIHNRAMTIISNYLPDAPLEFLRVTPDNCLFSYFDNL